MEHNILKPSNKEKTNSKEEIYDIVDFYLQPEFIKLITQQITEQSKVNFAKIKEIKKVIKNQSFVLDPIALTEKIIKFETELFNNFNKK